MDRLEKIHGQSYVHCIRIQSLSTSNKKNAKVSSTSKSNTDSLKVDDKYGGLIICKDCGKVNMNGISDKMTKIFPDINAIYIKHTGSPGEITSAIRSADGKSLHDQGYSY